MNELITPELMLDIQERAAIGHSTRQISEWLMSLGINYSHVSVSRVINKSRKSRAKLSEEIMRPILEKQLGNNVAILADMMAECQKTIELAKTNGDERLKMLAMSRMKDFLTLAFKVNGVATDDTENNDDSTDYHEMISRFDFKNKD